MDTSKRVNAFEYLPIHRLWNEPLAWLPDSSTLSRRRHPIHVNSRLNVAANTSLTSIADTRTMEPTRTSIHLPFSVDASLLTLPSPFPTPDELRRALAGATPYGRRIVARLWLAEGPPSAFRACPAIYEDLRGWLGTRLGIHPKQITLVGSARIGYSMDPAEFGKRFGDHSDLDLAIISDELFERLISDFRQFSGDYSAGAVKPRSDRQRALWEGNLDFGKRNIPKGFFDARKIPNFGCYPVTQRINQAMWKLTKKLEATAAVPKVGSASTRVYRDWQSFVNRLTVNLSAAVTATHPRAEGAPSRPAHPAT